MSLARERPVGATPAVPASIDHVEVSVAGLAVRYGAMPPVLSGVDFIVGRGETAALVGANGAGKSTLLRCVLGLVRPATGEVMLLGRPVHRLRPAELRRLRGAIGFVAQKHNLVPRLSVLSNVVQGCLGRSAGPRGWLQCLASRATRDRALQALHAVGLADLATRRAGSLSGGQSQRVAIARALVGAPRLILADEPAASLDPVAGEEVMRTFARVGRETGTTLLFTTHNLNHAVTYADRVLGLRHGRLALDRPAAGLAAGGLLELYG